ncbi:bifunctional NAD(P)H-hydrate repair enzyme [Spirochaetia bacterium]|nr:bifunctional NAD(P)H-hydrate repair enzyme [Spirochaetia bacterium]
MSGVSPASLVSPVKLVLAEQARALDAEASAQWGLNPCALVEAAGRSCAEMLLQARPGLFGKSAAGQRAGNIPAIVVLAGSGNNAADALVMLRALMLRGFAGASSAWVFITRLPGASEKTPLSEAVLAIQKLMIPVFVWDPEKAREILAGADIIIDGIAGTGLQGSLHGAALEMVKAAAGNTQAAKIAIDIPSGNNDAWQPGMPVFQADATLAIEPLKLCLYTPAVRKNAGNILPVGGIFPAALVGQYQEAELLCWENAAARIPRVEADAYKYERGTVEIRAGSLGAAGAAKLAASGAQAAGAGLVRLIVDPSLYPILAPWASGVMVVAGGEERFKPDAALLGPGWGRGMDRARLLESYLPLEEQGLPLILDADAISLAKGIIFHGNAILTPHAGEFAAYAGIPKEEILACPAPVLRRFAKEKNACILFKSHVLYIAAPDGSLALIDGMCPALGAGGSGDLLAGFCAAIAARWRAIDARWRAIDAPAGHFDPYACAGAAAALLIEAARSKEIAGRFIDPAELACAAAAIAGRAWLSNGIRSGDE